MSLRSYLKLELELLSSYFSCLLYFLVWSSSVNFLFDSLTWLYILPISACKLNFSLSGLVRTNWQPIFYFLFFFCLTLFFYISVRCESSISIANLWSGECKLILQPKTEYCYNIFISVNDFIMIFVTDSSFKS